MPTSRRRCPASKHERVHQSVFPADGGVFAPMVHHSPPLEALEPARRLPDGVRGAVVFAAVPGAARHMGCAGRYAGVGAASAADGRGHSAAAVPHHYAAAAVRPAGGDAHQHLGKHPALHPLRLLPAAAVEAVSPSAAAFADVPAAALEHRNVPAVHPPHDGCGRRSAEFRGRDDWRRVVRAGAYGIPQIH